MHHSRPPIVLSRSDTPELDSVQRDLRNQLFRRYRTRHIAVNPPAQATAVYAPGLEIPSLGAADMAVAVFLPADLAPALGSLAGSPQEVLVHPDIGLGSQGAYLSLGTPGRGDPLPVNVWLDLAPLLQHHSCDGAEQALPLVLCAGDAVALTEFAPDAAQLERCQRAIAAAQKPPASIPPADAEKARTKATRYGERPWLFMRYELRAGYQRRAVHWAPFAESLPDCVLE